MSYSGSYSQDITDLITHLKQVGLDLSATEMADALWLLLEIREYESPSSASEDPIELSQPEAKIIEQIVVEGESMLPLRKELPSLPLVIGQPEEKVVAGKSGAAMPIAIPAASALPQAMQIGRSLRPLMRKVKSRNRQMFDEEATVVRIVDQEIWSPVMQPAPERWLELAIVVEETSVFEIWQDTIAEFQQLMERHGAFRDVRAWQLVSNVEGSVRLFRRKLGGIDRTQPREAGELLDPTGRRLIWFVSDCTSAGWRSGAVPDLLEKWMQYNPVTVLQLLPGRFWDRSTLGWGYPVWLGATEAGLLNDRLIVEGLPRKLSRREVVEDDAETLEPSRLLSDPPSKSSILGDFEEGLGAKPRGRLTLPVVTLDPLSLRQWARMMVGGGDPLTAGVVLDLNELADYAAAAADEKEQEVESLTPEQLVQRFRGTASSTAQRLAEMMAAVPVSWSVIRLIQKNILRQSSTVDVAEIFLSGLLQVKFQASGTANSKAVRSRYEFDPAVRKLLISAVPISATKNVMEKVADDALSRLPEEVRRQLTEDIEQRLGRSPRSFEAFLVPELLSNLQLDDETRLELLPFAEIGCEVLRWLGREYAAIVDQVARVPVVESIPLTFQPESDTLTGEFPAAQEFEFEFGVFEEIAVQRLNSFSFTIATLETEMSRIVRRPLKSGIVRPQPKLVIKKINQSTGQASGYTESFGDRCNLEMVAIPGGSFQMGSPKNELQHRDSESPQHLVTVPPFFMGRCPVTQAQWQMVTELPQVRRKLDPDPAEFKGSDRPIENVSWQGATEFCARLSQSTGRYYRLPSEAEWEYACRAGTTTPFHFGETLMPELANYDWSRTYGAVKVPMKERSEGTTAVGQFGLANAFGLYDMHGNIWEWCADHWHSNYRNAPVDGSAWIDEIPSKKPLYVLRGGSWFSNPVYCRSASRSDYDAGIRNFYSGFRVVCSAPRI
jgi:formylglycine-generating enzyme required for sulfatase activity